MTLEELQTENAALKATLAEYKTTADKCITNANAQLDILQGGAQGHVLIDAIAELRRIVNLASKGERVRRLEQALAAKAEAEAEIASLT